jgi:hypothetical protein
VVSLALGFAGAAAVASVSALMAQHGLFKPVRYCGRNSIVIYLAFFLPMAASRTVLLRGGWIADVGTVSVLVTAAGVIGALALFWFVRRGVPCDFCSSGHSGCASRPEHRWRCSCRIADRLVMSRRMG